MIWMLSIGDMIDKLVIENIKIFTLRDKIHDSTDDEEIVKLTEKMMICNENRGIIANYLDDKVNNVADGKEANVILKKIKTYNVK
jgi:hypothetical protein